MKNDIGVATAILDAMDVGLLGVNIQTNTVSIWNKTLLTIWNLDETLFQQNDMYTIFNRMAEKTDHPTLFNEQLNHPDPDNFCKEWHLTSGLFIELCVRKSPDEQGYLFSFKDITCAKLLEKALLEQALYDPLTQLPNQALLQDRMQQAITDSIETRLPVGIILLDINAFHWVYDQLGAMISDMLLQEVRHRLNPVIDKADTFARFGGDQFVIILPKTTREDVLLKAHTLLDSFIEPLQVAEQSLFVTVNLGISMYPEDGNDAETLLTNARHALHQSKLAGKHHFQFYAVGGAASLQEKELLIRELSFAHDNQQLKLHYQSLVDVNHPKPAGLEVSLCWNHPAYGLLYPADFLEENEVSLHIGKWMLEQACLKANQSDVPLTVNVLPYFFRQPDFLDIIQTIITESGVNPAMIFLQITENLLLMNTQNTVKKMLDVQDLGIRWSLNNYDAGYSCFSWLKGFPFAQIKINTELVEDTLLKSLAVVASRVDLMIVVAD